MKLRANDLLTLSKRTVTDEGYLVAPGVLAKAGNVQPYHRRELGLDGSGIIKLYRPAEEVFAPEAMASFENQAVTNGHPAAGVVTADTWKELAVGDVRGIGRDGDRLTGTVTVRDKASVRDVLDGKSQLSNGYVFDLDLTPGTSPSGVAYDGVQRNIRGNHTAIVEAARGGADCRIADHNLNGEMSMSVKRRVIVDNQPHDLEENEATLVERLVLARDSAIAETNRVMVECDEAMKKMAADHKVELEKLTTELPKQVEAQAAERAKVVGDALALVPEYKAEGRSTIDVQRDVLTAVSAKDAKVKGLVDSVLGTVAVKDAEPVVLKAAFNAAAALVKGTSTQTSAQDNEVAAALVGNDGATQANDSTPADVRLPGRDAWIARSQGIK